MEKLKNQLAKRNVFSSDISIIRYKFQLNHTISDILEKHTSFLKIKPISPFPNSPQSSRVDSRIANMLRSHTNFSNIELLSPLLTSPKLRSDPRITNMLRRHSNFLNLKPISPIPTSPERANSSIISTTISLKNFKVPKSKNTLIQPSTNSETCSFHISNKLSKFCMDCFLIVNSIEPFSSESEVKNLDYVASCRRHIFTLPHEKPCDNCFWINYLKH